MDAATFARVMLVLTFSAAPCSSSQQCDHWTSLSQDLEYEDDFVVNCFNPDEVGDLGCKGRDPVVSWNVNMSDNTVGEMAIEFLLAPSSGKYEISLEYSDQNLETCGQDSGHFITHSRREYYVHSANKTDLQKTTCEKTGKVWFGYVYTGCYRVVFNFWNDTVKSYKSCPKYLETNYVKKQLNQVPVLNALYNYMRSKLHLIVKMDSEINLVQVNVKLSSGINLDLGNDVCQMSGVEDVCCSHVGGVPPLCRISKAHGSATCKIVDNSLICIVNHVDPGDYCMRVSITDDRCSEDTVWMDSSNKYGTQCLWYLQFSANKTISSTDDVTVSTDVTLSTDDWPKTLLYWCIAILFVLVSLVLAGIAVAYRRCTNEDATNKVVRELPNSDCMYRSLNRNKLGDLQGTIEVLLLYSLDCKLFMDLMTVFRDNLKKVGMKVHDCFDPECQENVSWGPTQWLRQLLARPEVKVVVVSSECALRRQLALDAHTKLCYAEPDPCSPLFMWALDYILREGKRDDYKRQYHVRFHRFTDEKHMLAHVTPQRIYTLPKHFSLLLQYMTRSDIADTEVDIEDNNVFDEPLDRLVRYKMENPHYLDHLLLPCKGQSRAEQCRLHGAQEPSLEQR